MAIKDRYDTVVIGGGAAGLSAAIACHTDRRNSVLLVDREPRLGGILRQCIHSGFGLSRYNEDLTGPEFLSRLLDEIAAAGVPSKLNTLVRSISGNGLIEVISPVTGVRLVRADRIILATGAFERTRENLEIAGSRPAGVFTGGQAQQLINLHGLRIGQKVVVQGSGDIGLILTRRLTLEGYDVARVFERLPFVAGLTRNRILCLDEFEHEVEFQKQIVAIHGRLRVQGVTVASCDEQFKTVPGTEEYVGCDTVVLSAGLIPDQHLLEEPGACDVPVLPAGNAREIHPTADGAAIDGELVVRSNTIRSDYANISSSSVPDSNGEVDTEGDVICILCPKGCNLTSDQPQCQHGADYLREQHGKHLRTLTTSLWIGDTRYAVRTKDAIPVREHRSKVREVRGANILQSYARVEIGGRWEY